MADAKTTTDHAVKSNFHRRDAKMSLAMVTTTNAPMNGFPSSIVDMDGNIHFEAGAMAAAINH